LFLVSVAFLASAVEMVEALTIVLAVGLTRGWRSPLFGVAAALGALALAVAALGPALALVPIDALRLVVGALLLVFGLQWLRKAILRAGGRVPLRDEAAIYRREVAAARSAGAGGRGAVDWYGFTLAFKGVFLEGLEVAFVVLTFGTAQGSIPLAAAGAAAAAVLVGVVGVVARAPLSRVPENATKFAVGLLLTAFGTFWSAEGAGIARPGAELALLGLLALLTAAAFALVAALRGARTSAVRRGAAAA
jgi:uncharacterized membrane protein